MAGLRNTANMMRFIIKMVYKEIFDAMAKSLNIEKIAKTYEDDAEEETHS